jgi:hypothetical protein
MNATFEIVSSLLKWIAGVTGFTYNEVNIIAYYIVLPFAYVILADHMLKKHFLKILYVTGVTACLLRINEFSSFSDWLFKKSVDFLLSFQFLGWNYIVSSVLICVVFPAMVFIVMLHYAFPKFFPAIFRRPSSSGTPPQNQTS